MIKGVTIFRTDGVVDFEVGAKLLVNGVQSNVIVKKIRVSWLGSVKVTFSNGNAWIFRRLPFIVSKGDAPFM